ncbi:MAG TPA: TonB-dependent receptor [Chiayiivirga sp.]|nr:TonB-dependent receptor [Chiayiivirga sp.]
MASNYFTKGLKRSALTVALGLCFAGGVQAQTTTAGVYGSAPAGATVTVTSQTGVTRTLTADANGRFAASSLPVGEYTITASQNGTTLGTRRVALTVGANSNVSFTDATQLESITVLASGMAPIDVTSVDTRTVMTSAELNRLPMRRSAEAIALLSPGAIQSTARNFGGLISFGGAGVSENAYYVNGFFSGNPVSNLGGDSLPFMFIDQQETYTGGYSAKYGRSDGGVISQIGKRGTNEWHFGGQMAFTPQALRSDRVDEYYPNMSFADANANPNIPDNPATPGHPYEYSYENPDLAGTLYSRGHGNESETMSYSAYASGPILKDRLFFFVGAEYSTTDAIGLPSQGGVTYSDTTTRNPRYYAKLDWNITNDHLLEYTYLGRRSRYKGDLYAYDFANDIKGALSPVVVTPVNSMQEYQTAKYTGYLTDTLTLSAQYGRGNFRNDSINPALIPGMPYIAGSTAQDPAITGGTPIRNNQPTYTGVDSHSTTEGLRVDLEWVLGDHTLSGGIDNMEFKALSDGTAQVAQLWQYGRSAAGANISGALGVGPAGTNGYWVRDYRYTDAYSSSLKQESQYIEDRWQVTDNLMLSLGVRHDNFTNKNDAGVAFMEGKNQWAPRLAAVWDVNGDSSLKVFANAGRYFLSLPNSMARRGASASNYSYKYYTYTGIDANGAPTGLVEVGGINGAPPPGYVSSNGELGIPPDPKSFAPSDLKYIYSDEYILGMEAQLGDSWLWGAKLTQRSLKSSVDDFCDPYALMDAAGLTPYDYAGGKFFAESAALGQVQVSYCYMFNPGGSNTYNLPIANGTDLVGGYQQVTLDSSALGFEGKIKRDYNSLDLFLAHPFDGTWEARIDYTYSKSKGNTEGQVKSEFGQADISKTQDWDSFYLMRYATGYMANDHRHQIKIRGSYAITPELMFGTNVRIQDGMPVSCLGYYNPDGSLDSTGIESDSIGYGSSYHTCFGQVWTPGSKRTPWTRTVDMGLTYTPAFLDNKLSASFQVFNVFNEQNPTQFDVTSEAEPYVVSNTFMMPGGAYGSRQPPRSMMLTISYDY